MIARLLSLSIALLLFSLQSYADDWASDTWDEESEQGIEWHGFIELGAGGRLASDPVLNETKTLAEIRGRFETEYFIDDTRFSLKADLYADGVEGASQFYLREALVDLRLQDNLDLRAGRQILTWGTGDLLFLNDLFAKDWQSFFSGRDDEYLKAPSASIKLAYFAEQVNLDLIWTPRFSSDNFINGERFSYFSPLVGKPVSAPESQLIPEYPKESLSNGELAARLYGSTQLFGASTEWALYGYRGYWKQPNGLNAQGRPFFPRLSSFGASLRTNVSAGIGHAEMVWYKGKDDQGTDPFIPNNQVRFLLGYEQEVLPKLTLGMQYYLEHTQDYAQLLASSANSAFVPDKNRELWTLRLTYRAMQDNLTLNWFSFFSPTDDDYYHRPSAKYRFNDNLNLTLGANLFGGRSQHTFFGQFEDASNLYARIRWGY